MILIGLLLLITGFIMNVKVLRGPLRQKLGPQEILRTSPFLVSVALIGAGFLLIAIASR